MLTYQDFLAAPDRAEFIARLIAEHKDGDLYRTAKVADEYDARRNVTIAKFRRVMYTPRGRAVKDPTAADNRIASGFFPRLNTQRCAYSLGNGVTFTRTEPRTDEAGNEVAVDLTKEQLGARFDTDLYAAAYRALIHGVSFGFWNMDRLDVFAVTEFAPLEDEYTGELMAGVRFYQVDENRPLTAVLYEPDGYTKYRSGKDDGKLREYEPKRAYKQRITAAPADAQPEVVGENYQVRRRGEDMPRTALPIVPLYGSRLHQSTLIGMREAIDSYDMVRSGFANDLQECAQIYWLLENYGGMSEEDLNRFRDRMKLMHIAEADTTNGGKVQAYTQEVPYAARQTYLDGMRQGIYEDFGGLNVTSISAAAQTATQIDAAYQPLDENADDFEYQIIEFVQKILALMGIEDTPQFKRNRITNQLEQVQMVAMEAPYLDDETILKKLPNITPDEIAAILYKRDEAETGRFARGNAPEEKPPEEDPTGEDGDT